MKFRLHTIAKRNIKFLKDAFSCQQILQTLLKKEDLPFIMPFNHPMFTKASYAFTLMLLYSNPNCLKSQRPPIRMNSSKQELEFCAYLREKFPHLTFIDAWSPFGQKTFKEAFPDSFCIETKTAFFFNGCLIHGHPVDQCKFQRKKGRGKNYFNVPLTEAFESHMKKVNLLKRNHAAEVESIENVWECEWQQRKKADASIQQFLKRYTEPPLMRLDQKVGVRGGINEVFGRYWINTTSEDQTFYSTDANSSYPFQALQPLPVGEYEVSLIIAL